MARKLLIGTNNKGKLQEFRRLLADLPLEVGSLKEAGIDTDVEETGKTYEENAVLKATTFARMSGTLTLADDSGLEVDALHGEPGVMSARYAGEDASDADRVRFLLSKLNDVPVAARGAVFRAVIAVAEPDGTVHTVEGACRGHIVTDPKGEKGFGYDPVFMAAGMDKTMAELDPDEKHRISHRGKAAVKARELLKKLYVEQG